MAALEDVLKAGPLSLVGLGIVGLALPVIVPGLRPQFAGVLKTAAKLFLEAEFEADNALMDRLVDTAVDSLLAIPAHAPEADRERKVDKVMSRFVSATRAGAHRRGWDEHDAAARYHRSLAKLDHAISRAQSRARASQHPILEHASRSLRQHHEQSRRSSVTAPAVRHVGSRTEPKHAAQAAEQRNRKNHNKNREENASPHPADRSAGHDSEKRSI
jgi:hypothetical protein